MAETGRRLRAVLPAMDGTLIESEHLWSKSESEPVAEPGGGLDPDLGHGVVDYAAIAGIDIRDVSKPFGDTFPQCE